MKQEDINGAIVYVLIVIIAVLFGFTVLRTYAPSSQLGNMFYLFILGAVVAGVIANAIIFELGHVIGAKLGGYKLLSVIVLGLGLKRKQDDKLHLTISKFDGITGETKILPIEKENKKANPTPFLLISSLLFVIELVVIVVLFILFTANGKNNVPLMNAAYFILTIGVIGGMLFLYNVLPFKLDAPTDGYRLKLISNETNKDAFNELLKVEYAIECGDKDVQVKTFTEITNFTAELNLNKVYLLLNDKKYKEAEELIDIILSGGDTLSRKVYIRAKAQKIYIKIMTEEVTVAKEYYEKEVSFNERKEISQDVSIVSIRAYLLMSGVLDKSRSECILALNNVYNAYKKTDPARREIEKELFNEALLKVNELHPDWELLDYKIEGKK